MGSNVLFSGNLTPDSRWDRENARPGEPAPGVYGDRSMDIGSGFGAYVPPPIASQTAVGPGVHQSHELHKIAILDLAPIIDSVRTTWLDRTTASASITDDVLLGIERLCGGVQNLDTQDLDPFAAVHEPDAPIKHPQPSTLRTPAGGSVRLVGIEVGGHCVIAAFFVPRPHPHPAASIGSSSERSQQFRLCSRDAAIGVFCLHVGRCGIVDDIAQSRLGHAIHIHRVEQHEAAAGFGAAFGNGNEHLRIGGASDSLLYDQWIGSSALFASHLSLGVGSTAPSSGASFECRTVHRS